MWNFSARLSLVLPPATLTRDLHLYRTATSRSRHDHSGSGTIWMVIECNSREYYITHKFIDNWIKTSPANRRAVMMTVEALRKEGHEVSEFNLPNGMRAAGL